jgi:hypothetical protein
MDAKSEEELYQMEKKIVENIFLRKESFKTTKYILGKP